MVIPDNGFNNIKDALNDLCVKADIIVVEEQWLSPFELDKLGNFNEDFQTFVWSAMNDKINPRFLVGRPFEGADV